MSTQDRRTGETDKPAYKPTTREVEARGRYQKRKAEHAPRVKAIKSGGEVRIEPDHPDFATGYVLLMDALGTADVDFVQLLMGQLANVGSRGGDVDEQAMNAMLSIVKGIAPRDPIEAMLATQMAAVHSATMTFARRLAHVDTIQQQDSAERAFNKLARTFTSQIEALKRYRTGGEQKVTVQHVNVGEGGQAIVGNVTQGRSADQPASQPLAVNKAESAPMPILEGQTKTPVRATRISKKKS